MEPLTAVIVVNWNGIDHLPDCLDSLLSQSAPCQVVMVDNSSSDGSVEMVRSRYQNRVEIIENPANWGYARAVNIGTRSTRTPFVVALNNDTVTDREFVAQLTSAARREDKIGMCAPKILSFSEPGVIDNAGQNLYRDGVGRGRGRLEHDRGQYDHPCDILLPSGCAVLLKRDMLDEVGGFDEDFFAYCDDTDLGLRARLAGWRCVYEPRAVVFHKYSASSHAYSPLKAFLVERNHCWVALKCLPFPLLLSAPFFTLLRISFQAYGILRGQGAAGRFTARNSPLALAVLVLRAWGSALAGSPRMWKKRREVQRMRKVPVAEVRRWFREFGLSVREIALID